MERGLYAAATGMMAQQTIQDSLAQNLANANTVGYKQDIPTFRALHSMAVRRLNDGAGTGPSVGDVNLGVQADKVYTDWQSGAVAVTNNALDASLEPGQFFTVQTPGGVRYTRAGNFQLDGAGILKTPSGMAVLGTDNQPIRVTGSIPPKLEANGSLTVSGKVVARLQIVQAPPDSLQKDGETLFAPVQPAAVRQAVNPALHVGTLEQSNVNVVSGLVRMITVSRGFEMAQRAIVTQDELLKHAANDLAHV
jgi:flagellar basal-body rod protein FlgF